MKYIAIVFCSIFCFQLVVVKAQERARIQFQEYSTGPGSFIQHIPVEKLPMDGDIHIPKEFSKADILLKDDRIVTDAPARYNAFNHKIEIIRDNKVFELEDTKIFSFHYTENGYGNFVNSREIYQKEDVPLVGFMEQLYVSDKVALYKRYEVEVLKANYNIALSTGNKNDTAKLIEKYFIFYNNRMHSFNGKSKEVAAVFGENAKPVQQFIKKEKLKFKKEEDYKKLVQFIQTGF